MKLAHFEALQPVCPSCRAQRQQLSPLALGRIERHSSDQILEGTLHCQAPECQLEYPIVDGIPLLIPDPRRYIAENVEYLLMRSDLGADMESLIGDCIGPGSLFDLTRQHLSSYCWDSYGDLDPAENLNGPVQPNGVSRCLQAGLERVAQRPQGPALDIGCSVGRSSFSLAADGEELVLGIDTNLAMLRVAQQVLQQRRLRYSRRRVGIVYDRREFDVDLPGMERVDFWACSALSLPFAPDQFGLAAGLQVLDSVSSPLALLNSLADTLRPGASAILATPYDWSVGATPVEAWIGGHSQRGPSAGAAEPLLRDLLTPGAHPASVPGLVLRDEIERFPWHTRTHDRGTMLYDSHIVIAEATAPTGPGQAADAAGDGGP